VKNVPKIKNIEKKIWEVEGFAVNFLHRDGTNVHGAKAGIPQYDYERYARNDWTVNEWKKNRFNKCYPGFDVEVLDGEGNKVSGQTKLGTVRDSYLDEE
jgi:hypothetical protein